MTTWSKWSEEGCPKCGSHSTVEHPGEPQKDGERKTVVCAFCYARYKITGRLWEADGPAEKHGAPSAATNGE